MPSHIAVPRRDPSIPTMTAVLALLVVPLLVFGALSALRPGAVAGARGDLASDVTAIEEVATTDDVADAPRTLPELAERSVLLAPNGAHLADLHGPENRRIVALDTLPDHVWQAVLSAEDRRFFDHDGYDVWAMTRAAGANVAAGRIVQGGSTITQQLAKTFVGDDLTLGRKVDELRVARDLEARYDKRELLEHYLNQVYFGAGAHGIAAAAEEFFDVDPTELTVEQASLLAAVIRAPSTLNPRRDPAGARQRRDAVLDGLVEAGHLDRRDAAAAASTPVEVLPDTNTPPRDPEVVAAVQREFLANPAFGETRAERAELLLTGGLAITTTIDVDLQRRATDLVRQRFPAPDGVTAAIAAVEPASGAVRVLVSGRPFDEEQSNAALQGRRQPGSAFKPFVLAAALEEGFSLHTTLTGRNGTRFGTEATTGDWATRGVRNFADASHGRVTAREALVRSINTAFADLVMRVGADRVLALTDELGISRAAYGGIENAGVALGGLRTGVSPLEMSSAYATFANVGIHTRPHVIARVVDRDGVEIHRGDAAPHQALDPAVSAAVRDTLTDVVGRGTGTRARLAHWPVAGKTGTTQDNHDVWFVGTTPKLSAAVWIGHPDRREPLHGMSSSRTAAPLWADFMQQALAGVEPVAFRVPGPAAPP